MNALFYIWLRKHVWFLSVDSQEELIQSEV